MDKKRKRKVSSNNRILQIKLALHYHNTERRDSDCVHSAPFPWSADRSRNRWRVQKRPEKKETHLLDSQFLWFLLLGHLRQPVSQSVRSEAALAVWAIRAHRAIHQNVFAGDHRVSAQLSSFSLSNRMTICSDTISWPKHRTSPARRGTRESISGSTHKVTTQNWLQYQLPKPALH